jgi:hypothetical protein
VNWPRATANEPVRHPIWVTSDFDGRMTRYYGVGDLATSSQAEDQEPLFLLGNGAVLSNVIIGDPAADGVHCLGTCTLNNVWWERVGEDAATFRSKRSTDVMTINGGGASAAVDKVFQNNVSGTMIIRNFYVENFGKLYRSCGNCTLQSKRTVIIENLTAVVHKRASALVGINENYGDVAIFRGKNIVYDNSGKDFPICLRHMGNNAGFESYKTGAGPDGTHCLYDDSTVIVKLPDGTIGSASKGVRRFDAPRTAPQPDQDVW